ncbi:MAG: glycogen/starch/alpha-glucan family phosphorylase [Chlamydiales bacterium]|nr:glycogen/starch/alpha-glucan family phosphorylase [Chlamydiales bacterium]
MKEDIEEQAEIIAQKARHYLITTYGRYPKQAFPWEIFQVVSLALRELVMINWASTVRTVNEKKARRLYFLSMEYLPGRMLVNNISNLHIHPLMRRVVEKLGYEYNQILSIEPDPGLGNGGLGRLASCFLDSLATQRYPATAYGLRYQYGIFEQQLWDGVQVEKPDCWLLNDNPWDLRRDGSAKRVKFAGCTRKRVNGNGDVVLDLTDYEEVRALPYDFPVIGFSPTKDFNVVTLRLWSTKESPHNFHLQRYNAGQIGPAAENTALTDVLYPNDNHETGKRIRLKQEFLLVSASLQDIFQRHLEHFPDLTNFADLVRIQINDTHPALVIPELMRQLTNYHAIPWNTAWEMTQEVVGYTNHTILSEALEEWNKDRLSSLLPRQYRMIEQINERLCESVRKEFPGDEERVQRMSLINEGQIRMAHLAISGSHRVNGVARLHGDILKTRVFKDFHEMFPNKITHVTNGVTQRHWLWHCNPRLADLLIDRIGSGWLTDFSQIHRIRDFADDPETQTAFLEIKKKNKERLLHFLWENNPVRDLFGSPSRREHNFDLDALFDVQIKRVHEYKRQLMNALHLIMVYHDLLEDPSSHPVKRVALFSGKAAAGYLIAKNVIQLICCLERKINNDALIQEKLKVVYVENYCVSRAEMIIPAADLSEQISTAGMEASGTGNMKLTMNGALTIGTEDGANIELREAIKEPWWPFSFGASADELQALYSQDAYNPWDVYSLHPKIKRAVESLKDGTFTTSENEEEALSTLFDNLMLGYGGQRADRYFVLHDLPAYYEMQNRVEAYFLDQASWAKCALYNIAGMGPFSTDSAIRNYASEIWGLTPCPVDPGILEEVRKIYNESTLKAFRG